MAGVTNDLRGRYGENLAHRSSYKSPTRKRTRVSAVDPGFAVANLTHLETTMRLLNGRGGYISGTPDTAHLTPALPDFSTRT